MKHMEKQDWAILVGQVAVFVILVVSCETASEREWSAEPQVETTCRNGYAVPRGNFSHVSYSNGVACAVADYQQGPVVCWNLHGCDK